MQNYYFLLIYASKIKDFLEFGGRAAGWGFALFEGLAAEPLVWGFALVWSLERHEFLEPETRKKSDWKDDTKGCDVGGDGLREL